VPKNQTKYVAEAMHIFRTAEKGLKASELGTQKRRDPLRVFGLAQMNCRPRQSVRAAAHVETGQIIAALRFADLYAARTAPVS